MAKFYKNSLINNNQKRTLCMLAKQAYDFQKSLGLTDDLKLEQWRRQEQKKAFGSSSLTKARQLDYPTIKGHFQQLANQDDKAFHTYLKDGEDNLKKKQTFHHLEDEADHIGAFLVAAGKADNKGAGKAYILAAAKRILHKPRLKWDDIKSLDTDVIASLVINAKRNLKSLQKRHPDVSA